MATKKTVAPENKLAQMRQDYAKALEEAFKVRTSAANVSQTVKHYVDDAVSAVIGEKLGLKRNTWGEWEVDPKSMTHSPVMDMLRVAVNEYFAANIASLVSQAFGGLTETDKKSLFKQYRDKLKEEVEDRLDDLAREQADKVMAEFAKIQATED